MKQKIISMLMVMVILLTSVDLSAFASEITQSGDVVRSGAEEAEEEEEDTDSKETEGEETTESGNNADQEEEGTSDGEETGG